MSKINAVYVSLLALLVAVVALVMCIVCCANKSNNVEETLNNNPEMIINAMQKYEAMQRENAMKAAEEALAQSADALYNNAADGVVGNPEGTVTLVEFFDFSCGYCHRIYPVLKNIVAKNADLKLVVKPLAFLSPMSQYAAKAALERLVDEWQHHGQRFFGLQVASCPDNRWRQRSLLERRVVAAGRRAISS